MSSNDDFIIIPRKKPLASTAPGAPPPHPTSSSAVVQHLPPLQSLQRSQVAPEHQYSSVSSSQSIHKQPQHSQYGYHGRPSSSHDRPPVAAAAAAAAAPLSSSSSSSYQPPEAIAIEDSESESGDDRVIEVKKPQRRFPSPPAPERVDMEDHDDDEGDDEVEASLIVGVAAASLSEEAAAAATANSGLALVNDIDAPISMISAGGTKETAPKKRRGFSSTAWTDKEDLLLYKYAEETLHDWSQVAARLGTGRTPESCSNRFVDFTPKKMRNFESALRRHRMQSASSSSASGDEDIALQQQGMERGGVSEVQEQMLPAVPQQQRGRQRSSAGRREKHAYSVYEELNGLSWLAQYEASVARAQSYPIRLVSVNFFTNVPFWSPPSTAAASASVDKSSESPISLQRDELMCLERGCSFAALTERICHKISTLRPDSYRPAAKDVRIYRFDSPLNNRDMSCALLVHCDEDVSAIDNDAKLCVNMISQL